ncbi:hypothetical protein CAI21_12575 [Alkalilimnicola ehrlichii]|uniref:Thioesterase domain-containing protein n=1 Tax=Alkalilimnicola ehrlichii TaxID=351052 RepID=A0A3E0X1W9_9GAMM|nr:hypothetical protein CAI21_12575 [Alkalilimnicola ehrlichii]RFA38538.1 hypothetical protein CAL65_04090 [Alkalilimnicola ehrlichii]
MIAYELSRALSRHYFLSPRKLFVSAKRAPHLPCRDKPLHQLPEAEFIAALRDYNGTPHDVLANEELMGIFLPVLRADFCLSESYRFDAQERLLTDLVLFGGRRDSLVPEPDLLAWKELFEGACEYRQFDGDHFFIHSQRDELLAGIADYLSMSLERGTV